MMGHDEDKRPICTAASPAPDPKVTERWNIGFQHPDAIGRCINDDHDDWRYDCPHCGRHWIYEGPDA